MITIITGIIIGWLVIGVFWGAFHYFEIRNFSNVTHHSEFAWLYYPQLMLISVIVLCSIIYYIFVFTQYLDRMVK
jgi:hypothetical protein